MVGSAVAVFYNFGGLYFQLFQLVTFVQDNFYSTAFCIVLGSLGFVPGLSIEGDLFNGRITLGINGNGMAAFFLSV